MPEYEIGGVCPGIVVCLNAPLSRHLCFSGEIFLPNKLSNTHTHTYTHTHTFTYIMGKDYNNSYSSGKAPAPVPAAPLDYPLPPEPYFDGSAPPYEEASVGVSSEAGGACEETVEAALNRFLLSGTWSFGAVASS